MKSNKLLTQPALEPVTLAEMKAHARIDDVTEENLLSSLITAARLWVEHYTGKVLISRSYAYALDDAPGGSELALPVAPVKAVTRIETIDDSGVVTIMNDAATFLDEACNPPRVVLKNGASWPVLARDAHALVVTYVAGYGDAPSDVPELLRLAIKQLALHWYEHRGDAITGGSQIVPMTVLALLQPYRTLHMGAL